MRSPRKKEVKTAPPRWYAERCAADRVYMLDDAAVTIRLSQFNFGPLPAVNHLTRLAARFYGDEKILADLESRAGTAIGAVEGRDLGLVTFAPDELDWDDEIRLAIESRWE
jgi:benzoyl-CoA-dihydrodiol lyase